MAEFQSKTVVRSDIKQCELEGVSTFNNLEILKNADGTIKHGFANLRLKIDTGNGHVK